eukprot:8571222-Alexandrium_andersonii.AAC.1
MARLAPRSPPPLRTSSRSVTKGELALALRTLQRARHRSLTRHTRLWQGQLLSQRVTAGNRTVPRRRFKQLIPALTAATLGGQGNLGHGADSTSKPANLPVPLPCPAPKM